MLDKKLLFTKQNNTKQNLVPFLPILNYIGAEAQALKSGPAVYKSNGLREGTLPFKGSISSSVKK